MSRENSHETNNDFNRKRLIPDDPLKVGILKVAKVDKQYLSKMGPAELGRIGVYQKKLAIYLENYYYKRWDMRSTLRYKRLRVTDRYKQFYEDLTEIQKSLRTFEDFKKSYVYTHIPLTMSGRSKGSRMDICRAQVTFVDEADELEDLWKHYRPCGCRTCRWCYPLNLQKAWKKFEEKKAWRKGTIPVYMNCKIKGKWHWYREVAEKIDLSKQDIFSTIYYGTIYRRWTKAIQKWRRPGESLIYVMHITTQGTVHIDFIAFLKGIQGRSKELQDIVKSPGPFLPCVVWTSGKPIKDYEELKAVYRYLVKQPLKPFFDESDIEKAAYTAMLNEIWSYNHPHLHFIGYPKPPRKSIVRKRGGTGYIIRKTKEEKEDGSSQSG